jgi:hypothetical protein
MFWMAGEADLPAHTRAEAVPLSREYPRFEPEVNGGLRETLVKKSGDLVIGPSVALRKFDEFDKAPCYFR